MIKRIFLFFLVFLATTIAGCGLKSAEPKLTRLTIAAQEWIGYGPFYLAQEKGFFKEEGVDLIFIDEQLDSARRDAFKQGMLDCEAATMDLLVSKAAQDTPIATVMELDMSFGADAIVANEGIKTLEDLAGKKVALARDDVGDTFISTLFYKHGLPLNALTIVPQRPEEVAQAFLNGLSDACVTWEPQVSEALKKPGAHILTSSKENPGIIIDTLNVRKDLLEKNPELVKKLMRGWFKALQYYKMNPVEASGIIAKYYKVTPDEYRKQVEGLAWSDYEKQRNPSEAKEWSDAFTAIVAVKLANGRIFKKPDAAKFINRTLLEDLY
ncbi:MAG: ABC transporter substrate-binding protein [Candidatus Omnitrophica bacterium]|nr:ABC transporter substrate-binding protein [Candidatus Omnitrophota bacterium]